MDEDLASPAVRRYRDAAKRHDAQPYGAERLATFVAMLHAMNRLTDHEFHSEQAAAWRRVPRGKSVG